MGTGGRTTCGPATMTQSLGASWARDPFSGYLNSPQSQNPYAYVMNNPADLVNPTGLCGFKSGLTRRICASKLKHALAVSLGYARSELKFCQERGETECAASIEQSIERLLRSVDKEMERLGDWTADRYRAANDWMRQPKNFAMAVQFASSFGAATTCHEPDRGRRRALPWLHDRIWRKQWSANRLG